MKTLSLALASAVVLAACAPNPGQNRYNYNEVGQSVVVDFATVLAVKPVDITGRNTGAGALAGGAMGAAGGSAIGNGSGQTMATVGGAVVGAIAGSMIEQSLANQKGYEYVLMTEHKQTKTVVQYQNPEDRVFKTGDRVMLQTKGTYQRLLPTEGLPDTVKRPKGITVVE